MLPFLEKFFKPSPSVAKLVASGAVIVDVRTSSEYQAGHLEGSRNIPLDKIAREVESLKRLNLPVITVCQSGNRSGIAKSLLAASGIEVYNGGGWINLKKQIQQV